MALAALSLAVVVVTVTALILVTGLWWRAEDRADRARRAELEAESRRCRAEEAEARLALRRGDDLCEQGEVVTGLLWLARGLELATSAGATVLDGPLRVNLAAWGQQPRPPGPRLPHPAPILALAFDPTGRLASLPLIDALGVGPPACCLTAIDRARFGVLPFLPTPSAHPCATRP